jgi:neutrophil cytosolic factor 2
MQRPHISFAPDPPRPTGTTTNTKKPIPLAVFLSQQPVGILYRPPENKMRNAKPKDYLGKAKLVAAENPAEAYTTFTGVTRMAQGYTPSGAPLEPRPDQMLSVGGGLAPSPSFSRARNPDTVKPVERSGSATARLERQNTTLQVSNVREAASAQKANTIGSRNNVSPPPREKTTSPVRGGQ